MMIMKLFILMINYFLSVGFFMFMERKFLGLMQFRLGPNKILFKGYLQFLMDLFKLLFKNLSCFINYSMILYYFMPILLMLNMIMLWFILPFNSKFINIYIGIMILLFLMLMKIFLLMFFVMLVYSVYSNLSIIRMIVQVMSYDILIILIFLIFVNFYNDLDLLVLIYNSNVFNFMLSFVMFVFWFMSVMIELIRLPFDFYEGESELISGFNIEFSSIYFVLMILIEYMEMIYFMLLTNLIYFISMFYEIYFYLFLFLFIFILIWFRVYLVRYRYDKMLIELWKLFFPILMLMFILFYFLNLI